MDDKLDEHGRGCERGKPNDRLESDRPKAARRLLADGSSAALDLRNNVSTCVSGLQE